MTFARNEKCNAVAQSPTFRQPAGARGPLVAASFIGGGTALAFCNSPGSSCKASSKPKAPSLLFY